MRHKKTEKRATFRFSDKDRKRRKSYFYQFFRAIILGLKFWSLVRKVH
ncbi:hypothetical protein [Hydrogenothermus marinus]|uniref:Uncharacterized protein n=1 Tax=Hydrogenothermus marinus TaxID=133270 RepID=A0A3M0BRQ9_9AQUI|nr:hypothetical protein [Hydrogenothermus marinus]RMA97185.1 hypothetical protein CLV39_0840 [Hydrogenothermus marinus]